MDVNATLLTPRFFMAALRVLWVATAVAMAVSLQHHHTAARVAWWVVAGGVLVALVARGTAALTAVRMVCPGAAAAAVVAWAAHGDVLPSAAALSAALLATALAFSAESGEAMVQGGAYGNEQRFPLRAPAPLLLPMAVSWLVWCAAVLGAVLAWCASSVVWGIVLTLLAAALSWLLSQRFHRMSRRWLVLVPAGVVVHDAHVLGETLMVQRSNVSLARLALADTEAADLTGPAAGHAVEVTVRDMVLAVLPSTAEHPTGRALHVASFLVCPTRPGRALRAMADAKIPVA